MAKAKCQICKKIKEDVALKIVGKTKVQDNRFPRPKDAFIRKRVCEDCWSKTEKGGEGK